MSNIPGTPIWYELITDDPDAAEAFYGKVLGWSFQRFAGNFEHDYRIASANGTGVGGVMQRPEGMPMPPSWLFYVGVEDVDAMAEKVASLGGSVHMPGTDIPEVGRFAFVADPQGNPFYLMRGASDRASEAFLPTETARPGHAVWNELRTPDPEAALGFYGELFGWSQQGAMPMGDRGDYRFLGAGSTMIGALMPADPDGSSGWRFYFLVDDVDAAVDRLNDAGGTVLFGPAEVPGGLHTVIAEDTGRARFGFVGRKL
ncbi:VOC family protein [Consotaella aegiceratis]|uniref:VOC family protein n=1 Tax=Consotaella aegiceratis TaxID=3097961 RepID=UPI002F4255AF